MHVDILTLFPEMFSGPFSQSMIKRALEKKIITLDLHDLRQWATDKHRTIDDRPYGGGPGMVMMIEPIDRAITQIKCSAVPKQKRSVILTSARGQIFTQNKAKMLAQFDHLIFIAGHYEGVDQRVADHLVDEELSIGNYVLTGGELPVMVMVDAIVRLLPGVVGDPQSLVEESHSSPGFIEYPQYTRPVKYKSWSVPPVLLSGNHAKINKWRKDRSKQR